jgi:hypothetical protein
VARVKTPVEGFTGEVAGVVFADGVGETDNPNALNYFRRHGYDVATPVHQTPAPASAPKPGFPDGAPTAAWTGNELKAYAAEHGIDLGKARTKQEMAAAIEAASEAASEVGPEGESAPAGEGN